MVGDGTGPKREERIEMIDPTLAALIIRQLDENNAVNDAIAAVVYDAIDSWLEEGVDEEQLEDMLNDYFPRFVIDRK